MFWICIIMTCFWIQIYRDRYLENMDPDLDPVLVKFAFYCHFMFYQNRTFRFKIKNFKKKFWRIFGQWKMPNKSFQFFRVLARKLHNKSWFLSERESNLEKSAVSGSFFRSRQLSNSKLKLGSSEKEPGNSELFIKIETLCPTLLI